MKFKFSSNSLQLFFVLYGFVVPGCSAGITLVFHWYSEVFSWCSGVPGFIVCQLRSILEEFLYETFRESISLSVCNFQSMKSPVELNSILSKFFLLYYLIRRDSGRLVNEAFTSNPIASSKQ